MEYDIGEVLGPLEEELNSRLEQRLSDKDALAVKAALAKAIARGHARGMALAAAQTNELLARGDVDIVSTEVTSPDFGAELDLWAEKYGQP
jgi:hypothetical protein